MSNEVLLPSEPLRVIQQNFLKELRAAQAAYNMHAENKTSLPFIVSQLAPSPLVQEGELFQALVIGGTVGKKALFRKTGDGIEIVEEAREEELPSLTQAKDFFEFIDASVSPYAHVIGINFAYPVKPVFEHGKPDGILLETSREKAVNAQDLVGRKIGEEIEKYMSEKRGTSISVAVGNDTTCLLLSGRTKTSGDNLACGIVGTGLNFGLLLDENTMANLESADFDKFPQSQVGKALAAQYGSPFGKEVNGWSLFRHFNAEIKEKGINFPLPTSTKQLSELSQQNTPHISNIAQKHLNRSAQLVACQAAGIAEFKEQDMVFVMEGSLFWKGNNYKETVKRTVKQLVPEYKIDFVEIEDSAIIGAAKLVS